MKSKYSYLLGLTSTLFLLNCSSIQKSNNFTNPKSDKPLEIIVQDTTSTISNPNIIALPDSTEKYELKGEQAYFKAKELQEEAITEYYNGNEQKAQKLFEKSMELLIQSDIQPDEWIFLNPLDQMERLDSYRNLKFDLNNNGIDLTADDIRNTREELEKISSFEFGKKFTERVAYYKKSFLTKDKEWFERTMSRGGKYFEFIDKLFAEKNLDPFFKWMYPIESAMVTTNRSWAGAVGISQFIPSTARLYGLKLYGLWCDERIDPIKSLNASVQDLQDLQLLLVDPFLTIAAYNAGERRIINQLNRTKSSNFDELIEIGVLPRETENHLPKIYAFMDLANNMKEYNFNIEFEKPDLILEKILNNEFDTVIIREQIDFDVIAEVLEIKTEILKKYNPAYGMWGTPPENIVKGTYEFDIRIPKGMEEKYYDGIEKVEEKIKKIRTSWYVVKRGDTLNNIAQHHSLKSYHEIARTNNLSYPYRIYPGQRLQIPTTSTVKIIKPQISQQKIPAQKIENTQEYGKIIYNVKKGDNFWSIKDYFNQEYNIPITHKEAAVDIMDIRRWNPKYYRTNLLKPGDKLNIYIPHKYINKESN